MIKDDIMRMAREANLPDPMVFYASIERFAAMIAAAEREACVTACFQQTTRWTDYRARYAASECAAAIRAREIHDSATRHP